MTKKKFNIFDKSGKDSIRIGYIHPKRGFIDNVSLEDANKYAKNNPRTIFIFSNRDVTRYLTINEVNALTVEDVKSSKRCEGIEGLNEEDSDNPKQPKLEISGCGGIGAAANPVVDTEGNIISVDVVKGGFGYKCPPKVTLANDDGVVIKPEFQVELGTAPVTIDFGQFDFEKYIIPEREDIDPREYGADGVEIGPWTPDAYINQSEDINFNEILQYQRYMKNLSDPWWNTRKLSYADNYSSLGSNKKKYDVEHFSWGEIVDDKEFIYVKFEVYSAGSYKNRKMVVDFVSEDGEHEFSISGVAQRFTQVFRKRVRANTTYTVNVRNKKRKDVEQGLIRNNTFGQRGIERKLDRGFTFEDSPLGARGKTIFADVVTSTNDNDDIQISCGSGDFTAKNKTTIKSGGRTRSTYDLTYRLNVDPDAQESFMNKYAISPVPPSDVKGTDSSGIPYILKWDLDFPLDGKYTFRGIVDDDGELYFDGDLVGKLNRFKKKPVEYAREVESGLHEIRIHLKNREKIVSRDVKFGSIFNTLKYINKSNKKLWKSDPDSGDGLNSDFLNEYGVIPFKPKKLDKKVEKLNKKQPRATIHQDKDKLFLRVSGTGGNKVEIGFRLKIKISSPEDNTFASKVTIESEDGRKGVVLKKSTSESDASDKEVIFGSGEFTDGEYRIRIKGRGEDFGFKPIDNVEIYEEGGRLIKFTDSIDEPGYKDGALKIDYIKYLDEEVFDFLDEDYDEVQEIVWDNIEFPSSTDYVLEMLARDYADVKIKNLATGQTKEYSYNLKDKKNAKKKSEIEEFFEKGYYKIKVLLSQKFARPAKKGKFMAFAMNVKTKDKIVNQTFKKEKSWQDNPIGVALTIDAPEPPKPRLETPKDFGNGCPPNPLWSTRFSNDLNDSESWWPVIDASWSKEMDKYAISPVKPTAERDGGTGSEYYTNSWTVGIAHTGVYGLRGSCDKHGKISVSNDDGMLAIIHTPKYETDSEPIKSTTVVGDLANSKDANPGITTFKMNPGKYTVTAKVRNGDTDIKKKINQKVFHTADWIYKKKRPPRFVNISFDIKGRATEGHRAIEFLFTEKLNAGHTYNPHTFRIKYNRISGITRRVSAMLKPNTKYKVEAQPITLTPKQNVRKFPIEISSDRRGPTARIATASTHTIKYTDAAYQMDTDAEFKILSSSPGIVAAFSPNGKELIVYGRGAGTIDLKLEWEDDPKKNGMAVGKLTVGDVTFRQKGREGKKVKTLKLDAIELASNEKNSGVLEQGTLAKRDLTKKKDRISLDDLPKKVTKNLDDNEKEILQKELEASLVEGREVGSQSRFIFADYLGSTNDDDDMIVVAQDGIFTLGDRSAIKQKSENKSSRSTYEIEYEFDLNDQSDYITTFDGAKYIGPDVAAYGGKTKKGPIGLRMTPVFSHARDVIGNDWKFKWEDVTFPQDGKYRIQAEGDEVAKIRIDGKLICKAKENQGLVELEIDTTAGKKTIEIELKNSFGDGKTILDRGRYTRFGVNPTYAALKITTEVNFDTGENQSWVENPIGISGSLIPPPCRVIDGGVGIVSSIIPIIPSGPFEPPPPPPPITGEPEDPGDPTDDDPPPGDPPIIREGDGSSYSVKLELERIIIPTGGINYDCSKDKLEITPDNGAVLSYDCDNFGVIRNVNIIDPGSGFTELPDIRLISDTGINAKFLPVFKVIRDPIVSDRSQLLSVTDLVGLKKTGYYNGRPYYGSIYYEDGVKYAGYYETPGDPVRIYDTLQESITGKAETQSSGIIRTGTDTQTGSTNINLPDSPDYLV